MPFDGETYERKRDRKRLSEQLDRVIRVMSDGQWHVPSELEELTGDPWASISARLRDLRKAKFGSREVQRRYVANGVFKYRLVIPISERPNPFTKGAS